MTEEGEPTSGWRPLSDWERKLVARMRAEHGYTYAERRWRDLLDEWRWWSSNWRKYPKYFLGEVGVLSFETFLKRHDIAERGRCLYERLSGWRRKVSARAS